MKAWAEQFYNSDAWRACREGFLQSKGYLCERCSTPDNPVVAKIAHHKIYLTKENINNPYIALSWDNLEALCQDCHNKEHHRGERKKRYSFDANGNLVYPPHSLSYYGGFNSEDGRLKNLRRRAHNGCTRGGVVDGAERGRFLWRQRRNLRKNRRSKKRLPD